MSTGDLKVNLTLKKFLAQQEMTDNFLELTLKASRDVYKRAYPDNGVFNGGVLSADTVDSFDISTPLQGTDGLGNDLVLDAADANNIPFPNVDTIPYFVALQRILIPDGTIETNQRTGKQQYRLLEERIGKTADPTGVVDDGDGTMTIDVESLFASGQDHSGRTVKVFLKATQDGGNVGPLSAALAVETLTVNSSNEIETVTALGQTAISTTASDYTVALIGPIVTTTDISSDVDKIFLGTVDGNVPGFTPDVFDNSGRRALLSVTASTELGFLNQQDFILTGGGILNHTQGSVGNFSWGSALKVRPLGVAGELAIAASNITLADGEVAFVAVPSPFSGGTPTMQKAARTAFVTLNQGNYWIAHRDGALITFRTGLQLEEGEQRQLNDIIISNAAFFSNDDRIRFVEADNEFHFDADNVNDSAELVAQEVRTGSGTTYAEKSGSNEPTINSSLNEVYDQTLYRDLLRITTNSTADKKVNVLDGRVTIGTGEEVGAVNDLGDLIASAGGDIDFSTGTVTNGTNFTPIANNVSEWTKYGVALDSADQIRVIVPTAQNASRSSAPEPNFAGFTMPLAVVSVKGGLSSGAANILDIVDDQILMIRKYPLAGQPPSVKYRTALPQGLAPAGAEATVKTYDYEIKDWDTGDGVGGDLITNVTTAVPSSQSVVCAVVDGGGGANYNGKYLIYEDGGFRRVLWFDIDNSGTTIPAGASALVALGYIAFEVTTIASGNSGTVAAAAIASIINNNQDWPSTNIRSVTASNATVTLTILHLGGGRREKIDASNIDGIGTELEGTVGTGTFFTAAESGIYKYKQQISMNPAPNSSDQFFLAAAVNKVIVDRPSASWDQDVSTEEQGNSFTGEVELDAGDKLDFRFLSSESISTLLLTGRFGNYITIEKVREKVN